MAASIKFFCAILFFICLIHGGRSQCSNDQLTIEQEATGNKIDGKAEWTVTLKNNCLCVFLDVVLACSGFRTQESIDSSILSQNGGDCIINNSNPIAPHSTLSFNYAWDNAFPFTLKNAQVACS